MDLDEYFSKSSDLVIDEVPEGFKSGFVSLVGRPNAGKSTLLNALAGEKVAITSKTSQTTRTRIQGIVNDDMYQMAIVDTPGIHKPKDVLGEQLNETALGALDDVDIACMVIDASKPIGRGDEWVAKHVERSKAKKVCVLSKSDIATKEEVASQHLAADALMKWDSMVLLSAKKGYNLDAFIDECVQLLPEGPRWFPRSMTSDQTEEMLIAEFIREKVLRSFKDEIPHSVGVSIDQFEYSKKKHMYFIEATILTERDSQKAILIGKGGRAIKKVGTQAREELEALLGSKVYLGLSVKVKRGWRSDDAQLRRFGYME